jgi:hypothetical protein
MGPWRVGAEADRLAPDFQFHRVMAQAVMQHDPGVQGLSPDRDRHTDQAACEPSLPADFSGLYPWVQSTKALLRRGRFARTTSA